MIALGHLTAITERNCGSGNAVCVGAVNHGLAACGNSVAQGQTVHIAGGSVIDGAVGIMTAGNLHMCC